VEKQATAKPTQPSVFPVDIPGYAVLAENIAAGQQPFPDGIQWLKQAGFDLAIHVRAPGEDDSADHHDYGENELDRFRACSEVLREVVDANIAERSNQVTHRSLLPMPERV